MEKCQLGSICTDVGPRGPNPTQNQVEVRLNLIYQVCTCLALTQIWTRFEVQNYLMTQLDPVELPNCVLIWVQPKKAGSNEISCGVHSDNPSDFYFIFENHCPKLTSI